MAPCQVEIEPMKYEYENLIVFLSFFLFLMFVKSTIKDYMRINY